ncbi:hypothetical protein KKA15_06770 [Patescibacteria group bacterium]|nr:hypothetical protein [Patescibacteria group bacterium]
MSVKTRDINKIFKKLKMVTEEGRDTLATLYYNGKPYIWTKVPHKKGDLKGKLPYFIRQQLEVDDDQFRNLIKCPLKLDGYIQILKEKNIIQE